MVNFHPVEFSERKEFYTKKDLSREAFYSKIQSDIFSRKKVTLAAPALKIPKEVGGGGGGLDVMCQSKGILN